MEKILVTTDFSINSKAGIRFAMQIASQGKLKLIFYHVIEITRPASVSDKQYKQFSVDTVQEFDAKLKAFVLELQEESWYKPAAVEYRVEIGMDVTKMIIRAAKRTRADYICTSTRGAGSIEKLFGTHSSGLISSSPTPLLIVPHNFRLQPIKMIFYASDFISVRSELKYVKNLAEKINSRIEVFHYDLLLEEGDKKNKLLRKARRLESPTIAFNFIRQNPESTLAVHLRTDIQKINPALVALFTKQDRDWLERILLSSESAEHSFNSNVPLLIFRKD